ncbi:hypothetical protein GCM10009745_44190 [Kribbella yunnanensis]|uniref:Type II toxin-antitoxin system HicA family toxin n=1 Tax=Kribbella yunnanensis TaxID=190194 RepID=A0ABN2HUM7_9ACTN
MPKKFRDADRELRKAGFEPARQNGSHITYKNKQGRTVIVPKKEEIKTGTWGNIEQQAGIKEPSKAEKEAAEAQRLADQGVAKAGGKSGSQPQQSQSSSRHDTKKKRGFGRR